MRSLIVGHGEIGKSLENVLLKEYPVKWVDAKTASDAVAVDWTDILHVCFPYSDTFVKDVKEYQESLRPLYTVIHSTVPVGTSRQLNATHSPVIGIHPHLERSLTTFTKFLSGEKASDVADYFRRAGMKVYLFDAPETTELLKPMDTTFYGLCVEFTKEIKRKCEEFGIPFEAWTIYNQAYNDGYERLGYLEYRRPNLVPIQKRLGGHCVLQNTHLVSSPFADLIQKLNEQAG